MKAILWKLNYSQKKDSWNEIQTCEKTQLGKIHTTGFQIRQPIKNQL